MSLFYSSLPPPNEESMGKVRSFYKGPLWRSSGGSQYSEKELECQELSLRSRGCLSYYFPKIISYHAGELACQSTNYPARKSLPPDEFLDVLSLLCLADISVR